MCTFSLMRMLARFFALFARKPAAYVDPPMTPRQQAARPSCEHELVQHPQLSPGHVVCQVCGARMAELDWRLGTRERPAFILNGSR